MYIACGTSIFEWDDCRGMQFLVATHHQSVRVTAPTSLTLVQCSRLVLRNTTSDYPTTTSFICHSSLESHYIHAQHIRQLVSYAWNAYPKYFIMHRKHSPEVTY